MKPTQTEEQHRRMISLLSSLVQLASDLTLYSQRLNIHFALSPSTTHNVKSYSFRRSCLYTQVYSVKKLAEKRIVFHLKFHPNQENFDFKYIFYCNRRAKGYSKQFGQLWRFICCQSFPVKMLVAPTKSFLSLVMSV